MEKAVQNLQDWLILHRTEPDITNIIIENVRAWGEDRPPVRYDGTTPHLKEAQRLQSLLGWGPFLRGFLSQRWKVAQSCHYRYLQIQKTGERWTAALIQKLWSVSWDMWRFRNGVLHSQSLTIPTNFTFLVTSSIISEMNHGHRLLPPSCTYLFQTDIPSLAKSSVNNKKLWLATVWSARDYYTPADAICQNRNPIVYAFVEAWKKGANYTNPRNGAYICQTWSHRIGIVAYVG